MFVSSSRILSRETSRRLTAPARRVLSSSSSVAATASARHASRAGAVFASVALTLAVSNVDVDKKYSLLAPRIAASGDVVTVGMPTKESQTGITFPSLCNGMNLVGLGVRIKYVFVKVYAVGTYMDPIAMMAVKTGGPDGIQKALLDPTYPRTIRIVMNRGLSIDKYTAAIVESIEPRLKGQDLET